MKLAIVWAIFAVAAAGFGTSAGVPSQEESYPGVPEIVVMVARIPTGPGLRMRHDQHQVPLSARARRPQG